MDETQEPVKQEESRNPDGTFKPGVSGNPAGRPKGKTLKEYAREYFMLKSDEEKRAYIEMVEEKKPGFAWSMAEGNPHQSNETELKGTLKVEFAETFKDVSKPPQEAGGDNKVEGSL